MLDRDGQASHAAGACELHGAMKECTGGEVVLADMGVPNGRVAGP